MTTPQQQQADPTSMLSQILLEQGRQGTQLAVISEQLKAVPDHESRIRKLEDARAKIYAVSAFVAALFGGGGTWLAAIINHK